MIQFEDCLAWRGNQESRDCMASLRAILLHRDHISSVPCSSPLSFSLSSISHQVLPPINKDTSHQARHLRRLIPFEDALLPSRTNPAGTLDNLKSSYCWEVPGGVKPGYWPQHCRLCPSHCLGDHCEVWLAAGLISRGRSATELHAIHLRVDQSQFGLINQQEWQAKGPLSEWTDGWMDPRKYDRYSTTQYNTADDNLIL